MVYELFSLLIVGVGVVSSLAAAVFYILIELSLVPGFYERMFKPWLLIAFSAFFHILAHISFGLTANIFIYMSSNLAAVLVLISGTFWITKNVISAFLSVEKEKTLGEELEKRASEIIRLKKFNQELVEHSPIGILRLDEKLRIIYENPEMKEMMGVPKGEESRAIGIDIRTLPSVETTWIANIFNELQKGKEISAEVLFKSIYGKESHLSFKGVPLFENENFSGAILLVEDITVRKKHEKEITALYTIDQALRETLDLDEVLRRAQDGILGTTGADAAGIFLLEGDTLVLKTHHGLPDYFVKMVSKLKLGEGITGQAAESMNPITMDLANYAATIKPPKLVQSVIKEGFQSLVSLPLVSKGKKLGAVTLGYRKPHDVPSQELEFLNSLVFQIAIAVENSQLYEEIKEDHEELQRLYEELKTLAEMKDAFISNVSHELLTPLTIVKASIELSLEEERSKDVKEILRRGRTSVVRLNALLKNLLSLAKGREIDLSIEEVDLGHLLDDIIKEFEPLAEARNIEISSSISDLPTVEVDRAKIGEVLFNLIDNAIKFNRTGGKVLVKAAKIDSLAEVRIEDTGIGIAKEHHDKIFQKFYQVDSSPTRGYQGAGIGLAITKGIVEAHGGDIRVESEPKKGSVFIFTLPLKQTKGE